MTKQKSAGTKEEKPQSKGIGKQIELNESRSKKNNLAKTKGYQKSRQMKKRVFRKNDKRAKARIRFSSEAMEQNSKRPANILIS